MAQHLPAYKMTVVTNSIIIAKEVRKKDNIRIILQICPANKLDILITDWEAPEEELKKFDELGIEVLVVEQEEQ